MAYDQRFGTVKGQLPFVGKMRKDVNLKHLFAKCRTGKPGRPRLYDGKVSLHGFSRWDATPWADDQGHRKVDEAVKILLTANSGEERLAMKSGFFELAPVGS